MANFAKIGLNNEVLDVQLIDNINNMRTDGVEDESVGIEYLKKVFKHETWVQTSFNTFGNKHILGKTPFRKNYAIVGGVYDVERDAFIGPKPYNSWVLDDETCLWIPPVEKPEDGNRYIWNEESISWELIEE